MQYNKISEVMDQCNLFGIKKKKNSQNYYFEKTRPPSAESFTGYSRIPTWITIMTISPPPKIEGASRQEIL